MDNETIKICLTIALGLLIAVVITIIICRPILGRTSDTSYTSRRQEIWKKSIEQCQNCPHCIHTQCGGWCQLKSKSITDIAFDKMPRIQGPCG